MVLGKVIIYYIFANMICFDGEHSHESESMHVLISLLTRVPIYGTFSANWTDHFRFKDGDVYDVDLVDYH